MRPLLISNSFSFKKHKTNSLHGSFLRARRGTVCREPARALLSAAQSQSSHRGHPMHRSHPPAPRALLRRPPAIFFVKGGSTSRLLCAKPAAPTQIDENEHDGPHVRSESQVVTNPNPKVRKSGAVAKAVLASMVLEEGSIRAARGDSRDIRRIKETSAARDAGFAVYSSFLPCTIKLPSCIFTA